MKKIMIFLMLLLAGCAPGLIKKAPYNYAKMLYEEGEELYKVKRYDESIKKLDSVIMLKADDVSFLPDALYLKAVIYIELARQMKNPYDYDLILQQFRNPKFKEKYITYYTFALRNLTTIIVYFPNDEIAPEAMFSQAQIYDYDNLQLFPQAIILYKSLIEKYPDSKERKSAEKRLKELREVYKGIKGSPHDITY
jgi:outer membrane protein assembly factor BamD (BamD/ComL family)